MSPGLSPWHLTDPCALGPTQPLKSEYQYIPGGKGGRCVKLTAYHLHVPIVKKYGGFNLLEPCGPVQACNGTALPLQVQVLWLKISTMGSACSTKHGRQCM